MVLVDKRILFGGIAMLAVGIAISIYISSLAPVGTAGMTDEAAALLLLEQRELEDYNTLAGILIAVGFMLVLISFGARKKRKGGAQKQVKKPAT